MSIWERQLTEHAASVHEQVGEPLCIPHWEMLGSPVISTLKYDYAVACVGKILRGHASAASTSYNHDIGFDGCGRCACELQELKGIAGALVAVDWDAREVQNVAEGRRFLEPVTFGQNGQRFSKHAEDGNARSRPIQQNLFADLNWLISDGCWVASEEECSCARTATDQYGKATLQFGSKLTPGRRALGKAAV